jgi:hypothetical protein
MKMVLNRIDRQQIAFETSRNAADVAVQSLAAGIVQPGSAILCAEDDVDKDVGERLRHNGAGYELRG